MYNTDKNVLGAATIATPAAAYLDLPFNIAGIIILLVIVGVILFVVHQIRNRKH